MSVRIGLEDAQNPKQPCVAQGKLSETLHNKKALSPIFATLIILAVVTVMFIPVFIWATGVTSQNQESWQLSGTIATERIVVEEVNLKYNQSTLCSIYIRNIGKTSVTINDVLITAPSGEIFTYEEAKGEFSTINPAGNHTKLNYSATY
jgi:flagellin-like protein